MPWHKIYNVQGKKSGTIPYELTFESDSIIKNMPTIEKEEFEYRREALSEINANTK